MIIEYKRDHPHCDDDNDCDEEEDVADLEAHLGELDSRDEGNNNYSNNAPPPPRYNTYIQSHVSRYKAIQNTETHDRLKNDLIEHLWNCYGSTA